MGRFAKLVGLRKIREEADGLAYSRILARIDAFNRKIYNLERETAEGHQMVVDQVAKGMAPGSFNFDNFFRGQQWRIQKIREKIAMAQVEAEAAKKVWFASRIKLKQMESMAEKEAVRHKEKMRLTENKELDMVGIVQSQLRS
ncbi:MAG: flagellar export protein FliJ [Magnetococcales bacterium]|nr:flagellar export protein FliJ [Magnetococcales bacterium]